MASRRKGLLVHWLIDFSLTSFWQDMTLEPTRKPQGKKKVWVSLEQNVATGHQRSTISYCSFIFCKYKNVSMYIVRWHSPHRNQFRGPSCPWSYGSWIFNYPCNQCLPSLELWVRIPFRWGVLDTTLCDELGTAVSSTNKTDRHDITEILLKVALNTITLTPTTRYDRVLSCIKCVL